MRQRFSGARNGRVVGGWHLEKAHGSVPCFLGLLAGHRAARQDCKKLFIAIGLPCSSYPGTGMIAEWQWPHKLAEFLFSLVF